MRFGVHWSCHFFNAAEGIENQFHTARDAQFVENPKHVVSYRVLGQVELQRNFLVPHPFRDQAYNISFARGQPRHPTRLLQLLYAHPACWTILAHSGGKGSGLNRHVWTSPYCTQSDIAVGCQSSGYRSDQPAGMIRRDEGQDKTFLNGHGQVGVV